MKKDLFRDEKFLTNIEKKFSEILSSHQGFVALIQPLALFMGLATFKRLNQNIDQPILNTIYMSSQDVLKSFVTSAPACIALLDYDLKFISVSPWWSTSEFLNKSYDVLEGQNFDQTFPCQNQNIYQILKDSLTGSFHRHENDIWMYPNGHQKWVRWEVQPWYLDVHKIGGVIIFCEDITIHQNFKKQVQELSKENNILHNFASICPHDLNGHIRSILSFLSLIDEHYEQSHLHSLDKVLISYLDYIKEATQGMKSIVQNALMTPRMSQESLIKENIDTNDLLIEIKDTLKIVLNQRSAVIIVENLPPIKAHKNSLYHVFMNLISNSLKYTSAKPVITISGNQTQESIIYKVKDNGIGIAKDHHHKIFNNHYRVESHQAISGNGIGLDFCKNVMDLHQGEIFVESQLGCGAVFILKFPCQASSITQGEQQRQPNMTLQFADSS